MRRVLIMLVFVLVLASALPAQTPPFDLLIRDGRIVDGTGNPWYVGDLGIRSGRIEAMGKIEGRGAKRTIDAAGLVVAPGFIDAHNHSDDSLLDDGDAPSMVRQGVTTVILGEGGSVAPTARWKSFTAYYDELKKRGIAMNVGSHIGSGLVWTTVHGSRIGPATPDERVRMREMVRQAMDEGALGVASSLSGPPGVWIDTESLVAMCRESAGRGGVYATHMRTEGSGVFHAVEEAIDIGRRAQIPVEILHLKIADHRLWGRMPELVEVIRNARAEGVPVQANVYPYRAGHNNLSSIIPPWAQEGGTAAMLRRLKDPSLRTRLEREILHGIPGSDWYNHYLATGSWDGMLLVSLRNPEYRKYEGKRMGDVIRALGKPPVDVLFQLLEANGGSVGAIYFHHSEKDMEYALRQPFVSIGSDGSAIRAETATGPAHPRSYGTFPRVLGRYVRETKLLTLEDAVRKMTSANAAKFHAYDRGLLRPGMCADITIFDPRTVADRATYEKPHQYANGIDYVAVNGVLVVDHGRSTGARPGTIVYGQGIRSAGLLQTQ